MDPYICGQCKSLIHITDRGGSTTSPPRGAKRSAGAVAFEVATPRTQPSPSTIATPRSQPSPSTTALALSPKPTTRTTFRRVLVCNHAYTTLGWYLGKVNPSPRTVKSVMASCEANAIQLRHGDAKTLAACGLACIAPDRNLFPGRCNFPSDWADTCVVSVRDGDHVQARRPGNVRVCRGVLWRVSDLQKHFAP